MQSQKKGSMSDTPLQKQFARLEEHLKQVLVGSPPQAGRRTSSACGDDRCFGTRHECHACGAPRANSLPKANPPEKQAAAIKAEPKADTMEEDAADDVPIEEQIADIEGASRGAWRAPRRRPCSMCGKPS
jgi:hypothetical protein